MQITGGDTTDVGTIATVIGGLVGVAILGYLGLSVSDGGEGVVVRRLWAGCMVCVVGCLGLSVSVCGVVL